MNLAKKSLLRSHSARCFEIQSTFSPEPPWARIRTPAPAASDLKSVGRLADPELLAAAVGHMKDFMAISEAQKRTGLPRAAHEGAEEDGGKAGGREV